MRDHTGRREKTRGVDAWRRYIIIQYRRLYMRCDGPDDATRRKNRKAPHRVLLLHWELTSAESRKITADGALS